MTKYGSDASIKSLVDKFDFYITPIVNPDGFVYSQTTDRLWRKNRQTVSGNSCVGRDINRKTSRTVFKGNHANLIAKATGHTSGK